MRAFNASSWWLLISIRPPGLLGRSDSVLLLELAAERGEEIRGRRLGPEPARQAGILIRIRLLQPLSRLEEGRILEKPGCCGFFFSSTSFRDLFDTEQTLDLFVQHSSSVQLAARIWQQMGRGITVIPGLRSLGCVSCDFCSKFHFNMWFMLIQASKVGI